MARRSKSTLFRKTVFIALTIVFCSVAVTAFWIYKHVPRSTFYSIRFLTIFDIPSHYDKKIGHSSWNGTDSGIWLGQGFENRFYILRFGATWRVDQRLVEHAAYNEIEEARKLLQEDPTLVRSWNRFGETPLHKAAEWGDPEMTKLFLEAGAEIDRKDVYGRTPLYKAVSNEQDEVADYLISRGADYDLLTASVRGDKKRIQILLENEQKSLNRDHNDKTALHLASRNGHTEIASLLIQAGIPVDVTDSQDETPLMDAAYRAHLGTMELLLSEGANPNYKASSIADTPLIKAVESNDLAAVEILLSAGASVDATAGRSAETPLIRSLHSSGNPQIAHRLIQAGARVDLSDRWGETALHAAIYQGTETIQLLLDHGAVLSATDRDGETPLTEALRYSKNREIIEFLKEKGAEYEPTLRYAILDCSPTLIRDIVAKDPLSIDRPIKREYHSTPLHFALAFGCEESLRTLLDLGASLTQKGVKGRNVLEWAFALEATKEVRLLKEYGATYPKKIHYAVMDRNIPLIDEILSASPNMVNGEKDLPKPIVVATQRGYFEIFKYLIEHGADLGVTNDYGQNLLQVASKRGHLNLTKLLHELEPSLLTPTKKQIEDTEGDTGKSPLSPLAWLNSRKDDPPPFFAARAGHVKILRFFLEEGFPIDSKLRDGGNLCSVAVQSDQPDVLEFLLVEGCDPTVKDRWKKSAIDYALEENNSEMIEILKRHHPEQFN